MWTWTPISTSPLSQPNPELTFWNPPEPATTGNSTSILNEHARGLTLEELGEVHLQPLDDGNDGERRALALVEVDEGAHERLLLGRSGLGAVGRRCAGIAQPQRGLLRRLLLALRLVVGLDGCLLLGGVRRESLGGYASEEARELWGHARQLLDAVRGGRRRGEGMLLRVLGVQGRLLGRRGLAGALHGGLLGELLLQERGRGRGRVRPPLRRVARAVRRNRRGPDAERWTRASGIPVRVHPEGRSASLHRSGGARTADDEPADGRAGTAGATREEERENRTGDRDGLNRRSSRRDDSDSRGPARCSDATVAGRSLPTKLDWAQSHVATGTALNHERRALDAAPPILRLDLRALALS